MRDTKPHVGLAACTTAPARARQAVAGEPPAKQQIIVPTAVEPAG